MRLYCGFLDKNAKYYAAKFKKCSLPKYYAAKGSWFFMRAIWYHQIDQIPVIK